MRFTMMLAALAFAVAALAGCNTPDGGEEHLDHTCPDGTVLHPEDFPDHDDEGFDIASHCPGSVTPPTPPPTPNVPPVLVLTVSDANGTATTATTVGGTLVFSAEGSSDPDGTIAGIAVTVTDSNRTRFKPLHDGTSFMDADFAFDRPGPVTVTVSMVDNRGAFATNNSFVYVNEVVPYNAFSSQDGAIAAEAIQDDCAGPTGQALVDGLVWASVMIPTLNETSFVEATVDSGALQVTICDPAGTAVSTPSETTTTSNPGTPFIDGSPTSHFYVSVFFLEPSAAGGEGAITMTVHYEPQPAAAA